MRSWRRWIHRRPDRPNQRRRGCNSKSRTARAERRLSYILEWSTSTADQLNQSRRLSHSAMARLPEVASTMSGRVLNRTAGVFLDGTVSD
jgi:hypothetical protein